MNAVKVDRENLIATLTENRANHKAEFDQAIEGYKQQAADALREQADKVAEDADAHLYVSLPKPEDHTEDYDEVISMLTWSTEEQVEIGHTDFRNYVLDKWDWKARASATASLYNS